MKQLLELVFGGGSDRLNVGSSPEVVIGPAPQLLGPAPEVIGPAQPDSLIEPPPRFAWDEKRWTRTTKGDVTEVCGRYRVLDRRTRQWREFDGQLRQHGRTIATYIADPPPEIRRHRHGACLQLVDPPWFRLHWTRRPTCLDSALIYMERMLDESING